MKAIAIIEILDGGKGKWYIDGEIHYTEDESLMKKFDVEMIPLKPMPQKRESKDGHPFNECYADGWNACLREITGENDG